MRRLGVWIALLAAGGGCGGRAAPAPEAPVAEAGPPPALVAVRAAGQAFETSAAGADDWRALAAAVGGARPALAGAPRAEAELVLVLAATRLVEVHLPALHAWNAPAQELVAGAVLPLAFDVRALDGETTAALRDRLCEGPASEVCAGVLPDYWGLALAYAAAGRLHARAGTLVDACGCAAAYRPRLARSERLAGAARVAASDERPGWALERDPLARSAFAPPELPPGDVVVRLERDGDGGWSSAGAPLPPVPARTGRKARAEKAAWDAWFAQALAAAGKPAPGHLVLLAVEARTDLSIAALTPVAAAAQRAGFGGLLLEVRIAAPPSARGFLRVELAARKAPPGLTPIKISGTKKSEAGVQAVVDHVDAIFGAAGEGARPVWVLP